eukprot:3375589-Pyramimonas_sp.AAC.1
MALTSLKITPSNIQLKLVASSETTPTACPASSSSSFPNPLRARGIVMSGRGRATQQPSCPTSGSIQPSASHITLAMHH